MIQLSGVLQNIHRRNVTELHGNRPKSQYYEQTECAYMEFMDAFDWKHNTFFRQQKSKLPLTNIRHCLMLSKMCINMFDFDKYILEFTDQVENYFQNFCKLFNDQQRIRQIHSFSVTSQSYLYPSRLLLKLNHRHKRFSKQQFITLLLVFIVFWVVLFSQSR